MPECCTRTSTKSWPTSTPNFPDTTNTGTKTIGRLRIFFSNNYFRLPIVWASSIITRARKEGRIRDDFAVKTLIDELNKLRGQCGLLLAYDNISIPLVYTQVGSSLSIRLQVV